MGLQETISYPLVNLEDLERVNYPTGEAPPLKVANPMSAGQEYLRPTLRASLLATLSYNEGHNEGPFRLFEQGRIFLPRPSQLNQLPEEREVAAGVIPACARNPPGWWTTGRWTSSMPKGCLPRPWHFWGCKKP